MRNWRRGKCTLPMTSMICGIMAFAHPFSASEASTELTVYTPHDQIVIFSDEEFTSDNGVVSGAGTSEDPYVIEGWDIDISDIEPGDGTLMGGIHIGNTWSSFVIRSVRIHGDYEPIVTQGQFSITGNPAIVMYFGANARIENCELTNTTDGITITRMSSVVIKNNTITGNGRGIRIDESSNLDIEDNYVADNQFGNLELSWISDSLVKGNTIANSGDWMGMNLYDSDRCTVLNNTISNNSDIGLNLGFCRDCRVAGNTISDSRVGIQVYGEEDLVLEENIYVDNSKNVAGLSDGDSDLPLVIALTAVVVAIIAITANVLAKKKGLQPPK